MRNDPRVVSYPDTYAAIFMLLVIFVCTVPLKTVLNVFYCINEKSSLLTQTQNSIKCFILMRKLERIKYVVQIR